MLLSLIIAAYKNISALEIVFETLSAQSFKNFEVIIAEDNDSPAMLTCIETARQKYFFPIQHISQPDMGFRKTRALNAAIKISQTDYLVFIDGDCLLHRHFLKQHYLHRKENTALFGRRVILTEKLTDEILNPIPAQKISFNPFKLLLARCGRLDAAFYLPFMPTPIEKGSGIWGCNWSIQKKNLYAVNGFDEDYVSAGIGEDTDIEWRLKKIGVQLRKIKFQAIQYHLYHPENYSSTSHNEQLMAQKKDAGLFFCKHGIIDFI